MTGHVMCNEGNLYEYLNIWWNTYLKKEDSVDTWNGNGEINLSGRQGTLLKA
jgi:hypothetical protein